MRKLVLNLSLLLAATLAAAQSPISVTGNMGSVGSSNITSNAFVRFSLQNCGSNRPRVLGTTDLVKTTFDFHPDQNGNISGSLWPNTLIDCGGNNPTQYLVTYYLNGAPVQPQATYTISGNFNLTTATPNYVTPVVPAPTGDTTYQRLDGGNAPIGSYTPANANAIDLGTLASAWRTAYLGTSLSLSGATSGNTLVKASSTASGTLTLPATTDTVVARSTTDTLSNKTIPSAGLLFAGTSGTTNLLASATASGTLTLPAATDTLTGKATTDTLTNKTLTAATSGNAVTLLNQQGPSAALTGNSGDQTVYTYTIPANTIQAAKGFRVTVSVLHSSGTGTVTYKMKVGSTVIDSTAAANDTSSNTRAVYEIFNNAGVQNAQNFDGLRVFGTSSPFPNALSGTIAENFANSIALTFSFNIANTDQVTPKFWMVELIQ